MSLQTDGLQKSSLRFNPKQITTGYSIILYIVFFKKGSPDRFRYGKHPSISLHAVEPGQSLTKKRRPTAGIERHRAAGKTYMQSDDAGFPAS
jgi:hypothetical protein